MMDTMISPCTYCSRVADPRNCDNKKCVPWQRWFTKKWEQTRKLFAAPYEKAPLRETGVPLGGRRYSPPHRVRAYRENGPCPTCKLPRDLCDTPCQAHKAWQHKEDNHELES